MKIVKVNFPSIVPDNEMVYINTLSGFLESLDAKCIIQITKRLEGGINVRISPSHPRFLEMMIQKVKDFHNLYYIRVEFSKSMKKGSNINFNINQ
jgi:hypothetical protein